LFFFFTDIIYFLFKISETVGAASGLINMRLDTLEDVDGEPTATVNVQILYKKH
jgi:hypothetical protein